MQSRPDVFILAAGRGERLRPLTDTTPKPLLRVGGKSLLTHHLEKLASLGFNSVIINLAWLGEQIRDSLAHSEQRFGIEVRYSEEVEGALGTGGGIVNALPRMRSDPFIVLNADVLCDFNYANFNLPQRSDLQLLLTPNPSYRQHGDFDLRRGRLCQTTDDNSPLPLTYTGIGCFRHRAFANYDGGRFALIAVIEQAIAKQRASGVINHGMWMDVGTSQRLAQAQKRFP